jgi:hypothetical protein
MQALVTSYGCGVPGAALQAGAYETGCRPDRVARGTSVLLAKAIGM